MAAKDAGAGFVMVTGHGPRDAERLQIAEALGADLAVDVAEHDPVRALRTATGGRLADVVVDVTAKAPAAFGQAVKLATTGGTMTTQTAAADAQWLIPALRRQQDQAGSHNP